METDVTLNPELTSPQVLAFLQESPCLLEKSGSEPLRRSLGMSLLKRKKTSPRACKRESNYLLFTLRVISIFCAGNFSSLLTPVETGKNFREILTAENIEAYLKTVNFWDRFAHELAARGHAVEQDELPQQEMRWKRREFDYNTNNVHNRAYQQDLSAFPEGKSLIDCGLNFSLPKVYRQLRKVQKSARILREKAIWKARVQRKRKVRPLPRSEKQIKNLTFGSL